MKLRASLTQSGDGIKGVVEFGNDQAFNLEAVLIIIERISETSEVSVEDILGDLWRINKLSKGQK